MLPRDLALFAQRWNLTDDARAELIRLVADGSLADLPTDEVTLLQTRTPTDSETTFLPDDITEDTASRERLGSADASERYELLCRLGEGGMGTVVRVRDRVMNRTLAMKLLGVAWSRQAHLRARFVAEAQATAQLEHPGIVPVHEMGELTDGRAFFTMKEIRGRTLTEVILEVHAHDGAPPSGWTLRRLVDAFHTVCEAIAYAHSRGVVHRDLKPDNVMVGGFGEVLVVDWGLAKVLGRVDLAASMGELDPVVTERSAAGSATVSGSVAGTPAYMPPEQARGEVEALGPASDVYSLGAILYEVLTGRRPYHDASGWEVLDRVIEGPPEPLRARPQLPIPDDLVAICGRAMQRAPSDRFPDAAALGTAVGEWLDGARRRARALGMVHEADSFHPRIQSLRDRAEHMRVQARDDLRDIPLAAPVAEKKPIWDQEDEAERLDAEADLAEVRYVRTLQGALTHAPELQEAHQRLAAHYRDHHRVAEERGDASAARRHEALLRSHDDGTHAEYLAGTAWLTLHTEPAGAEVEIFRYVERDRRLEPEATGITATTPLDRFGLPAGSYLLVLRAPGRHPVRYPVLLDRGEHFEPIHPHTGPRPVFLPVEGAIAANERYVPAGWFIAGDDPNAADSMRRTPAWVESFAIRAWAVTCGEYLAFLNDLTARGRLDEVHAHRPRAALNLAPYYAVQDEHGTWVQAPDAEGLLWEPDWPIVKVDWDDAMAYAAWEAEQTGQPWRLLAEMEWEKAARGVDARAFPFGNHFDANWAWMRHSYSSQHTMKPVTGTPLDVSPYDVYQLAGNAGTWILDAFRNSGAPLDRGVALIDASVWPDEDNCRRLVKGGSWNNTINGCRAARRAINIAHSRFYNCGIRLARPFVET